MSSLAKPERVAKVIARAGLCSRREAERWILDGRVEVDGQVIKEPGTTVTQQSQVKVDKKPLPILEKVRLWCYYKPSGLVTTHQDPEGRLTVFETLPKEMPRVISVGRLDQYSEGLLLLTNDGEFARKLEHPSSGLLRTYRVQTFGVLNERQIAIIRKGVTIDGFAYRPIDIRILSEKGRRAWLMMTLQEGKNREIRNILDFFQIQVLKLIREEYGPYSLGNLMPGEIQEVIDPQDRIKIK